MKTYRSCYAPDFQSKEMDLDAWISHKSNVRQKSKNIKIRIDNLQISVRRKYCHGIIYSTLQFINTQKQRQENFGT